MQESEEGDSAGAANHHFVKQALQPLVSMLLEQLVKQEEGQARGLRSEGACCRSCVWFCMQHLLRLLSGLLAVEGSSYDTGSLA